MSVTADSTAWTADTHCVTADGRVVCIEADIHEAAAALDLLDAVTVAATAVVETANALDALDAVTDTAAAVLEAATALDETDAAIGAQVLFGTVDEAADALDALDATVEAATVPIDGGGGYYPPPLRPAAIVGRGYGILPQLRGEAPGVVGAVGAGVGTLPGLVGEASGSIGVTGRSAAQLHVCAMATGASGMRGAGAGVIVKFSGTATGRHDDDEAAVIAFLLAA